MESRQRRVALVLAVPGAVACLLALWRFFASVVESRLGWHPLQTAQEHYVAVGRAFGDGFTIGFFLCFFLMLAAFAVGTWFDQRRAERARAGSRRVDVAARVRPAD